MATQDIVLLDLPSKPPCKCWTPNPWKTRLVLNYKGLDYKTEWVEYPDIKPRLADHFPKDKEEFTIPTVMMPDGSYVMDSLEIAELLEKKYPEPSLHLDSPYLSKLQELQPKFFGPIRGIFVPKVPKLILNDASVPYFVSTRENSIGVTLDQYAKEKGGEVAYQAAAPALKELTAMLKENGDGPYFMGKTVSYADFQWASVMIFFQRLGELDGLLKATGDAEPHRKLLEAVKPWAERDDH
ncbi:Uu.00g032160.m01.CDS01 [Anthostomella pinea]|uniref:Uu.00g032160.m01.CDS01 n=1 Tax=Anthostomella pinea TaxID=933095 RepID=A0AAI8V3R3_9PEZI|nr:Uu.00g032160.m01.CDS01 [Anthostomella pinea]